MSENNTFTMEELKALIGDVSVIADDMTSSNRVIFETNESKKLPVTLKNVEYKKVDNELTGFAWVYCHCDFTVLSGEEKDRDVSISFPVAYTDKANENCQKTVSYAKNRMKYLVIESGKIGILDYSELVGCNYNITFEQRSYDDALGNTRYKIDAKLIQKYKK